MPTAHERPKQPQRVRRDLLDCAAKLVCEAGAGALTVQAVASLAGVTKGGLFHHFPNKQALLEALFADLLEVLDREIDGFMKADPQPHGRFTRAYVESVFCDRDRYGRSPLMALSSAMITDARLGALWLGWLAARLQRHRDTDDSLQLEMVRLAADGVWLADLMNAGGKPPAPLPALRQHLLQQTLPGPT